MKIAVLIKQVPDTASKITLKPDRLGIDETGIKFVISPYDEYAVEEALRARDAAGGGETVAISLGPEKCVESIRTALAMGVDKAIHVDHEGKNYDSFATAKILAKVLEGQPFDIIFCGKQATDGDNGQVAQMIAEFLDIPQVMAMEKFELGADKKSARVMRMVPGGVQEIYEVSFPVILSCEKTPNNPRFASLPGIMKAKSKPLQKLKASALAPGLENKTNFVNYEIPPEKAAGRKIEGEPARQVAELVRLLREEAKVI